MVKPSRDTSRTGVELVLKRTIKTMAIRSTQMHPMIIQISNGIVFLSFH
jgi:hypothetical protein